MPSLLYLMHVLQSKAKRPCVRAKIAAMELQRHTWFNIAGICWAGVSDFALTTEESEEGGYKKFGVRGEEGGC